MRVILRYLRPFSFKIGSGLCVKAIGTVMDLFLPWILAYLIDIVVPERQIVPICLWGSAMMLCSIVAIAGNVSANRMASAVARDATRSLRRDLFVKISQLNCSQIDNIGVPTLMSRLTSDTYNVHRMIGGMQRMGVRAPILFVGGICLSMILEPVLALVLLTMLPFIVLVIFLVSRNGIRLYKKLQAAGDIMIRIVRENATGIRVIKALSKEAHEKRRFQEANAEITERERRVNITMGITNPTIFFFLNLGFTAVIVVGAYRVNIGLTHPGEILAFLTYFTIILNAMLTITRMFTVYSQGLASGDRISDVLSLQCAQPPHRRNHEESPHHVEFRNVSFSYDGQTDLLKDVNFAIKRGETLGIIGETGCGKSTVVQLLLRFYDPRKGDIRINGDDARGIPAEEFFSMFGVAFQNDVLFADTVLRNVDFGRELTPEAVKSAVNRAQAADFVDAFADGYEHLLTPRGTNLSGGQRQRLIIARALAARPQILILDDSFSALDYRTDANIRHMLRDELTGVTTIIVATRISSIVHANHILVLEQGKVAGYGTHEKLLEYCAIYGEICESQEFRKNSRVK